MSSWSTERIVLVLCGLVGSGKSTFATALQACFPQFVRCSQDELGDRKLVEELVIVSLERGASVCVDRTNVDEWQRATWISLAKHYPGTLIWALVFDTPKEVCRERILVRKDHPTIHSPTVGLQVLDRFARDFQPPRFSEGFDKIYYLPPHSRSDFTQSEVAAILDRISESWSPRPSHDGHVEVNRASQSSLHERQTIASRRSGGQSWIPARRSGTDDPQGNRRERHRSPRPSHANAHRSSSVETADRDGGRHETRYEPYKRRAV